VEQTWRTTLLARGGSAAVAAGMAALGVFAAVQAVLDFTGAALLLAVMCFATAAVMVGVPFRAFIRVDEVGVSCRTLVATRTIPWADLRGCRAGYSGIALLGVDGSVVNAFAVQKSNLATWRHWRTRADEVCEIIERLRVERGT
jgi:hypothetical protein